MQAAALLLAVAATGRLVWWLLAPALPELVALGVVLAVLGFALFGRRME